MVTATIIEVWADPDTVFIKARVTEGGVLGDVDYTASVDRAAFELEDTPGKLEMLRLALVSVRDAVIAIELESIAISGTVEI